jgi:CRP-like cAMP-binding protein
MSLSLGDSDISEKSFQKGEVLLKEGEKSRKVYLISSGKVILFTVVNGRVSPLYIAGPGEVIGEEAMFDNVAPYFAVTLENSKVVEVLNSDLTKYLKSCPDWIGNIVQVMSDRLHSTQLILKEHKIVDARLNGGADLSPEDEAFLQSVI